MTDSWLLLLLSSKEGSLLGIDDGTALGSNEGVSLGNTKGVTLGRMGSWVLLLLCSKEGSLLGINDGAEHLVPMKAYHSSKLRVSQHLEIRTVGCWVQKKGNDLESI
eukprot:scaffold119962_cov81-Attheya_sp.AAC.3